MVAFKYVYDVTISKNYITSKKEPSEIDGLFCVSH
jgi:hypothetical protein